MTQLRTVLFSTLFPSAARPGHGLFVETRLRELVRGGGIDVRVIAPVPWFPSRHVRFGDWARMAETPLTEVRHGIEAVHPRYLLPPRVGETMAPLLLAAGALAPLRKLLRSGFDFDLIDAHYYYPDGVAAALLGRWLGKPVVITARGSDLNVLGRHALPRRMMRWAASQAAASIGVSGALVDVLRGWQVDAQSLHVMRNGVDLERFRPLDRDHARARLSIVGSPLLLSVGHLVPVKGHDLILEALALTAQRRSGARLVVVGDGPLRGRLAQEAQQLGVAERVHFAGAVANEQLAAWYSAADATLLASHSEGCPNVLLESMACGTPVVATAVGGAGEILGNGPGGVLVHERSAGALAAAIDSLCTRAVERSAVRGYASGLSWEATSKAQLQLFTRIAAGRARVGPIDSRRSSIDA
jgi:teichuronic acid biosynthesis glycosyltransferase TuaC